MCESFYPVNWTVAAHQVDVRDYVLLSWQLLQLESRLEGVAGMLLHLQSKEVLLK